jgi:hypothetical protein
MRCLISALLGMLTIPGVDATQRPVQESVSARRTVTSGPGASTIDTSATVTGSVWTGENLPVADATVRLRNVHTGRIESTMKSDAAGRFRFDRIEGGSYVIEVVDDKDEVIAVSPAVAVAPGETVATFVRLGAQRPWFSGILTNAATAAVTTAAGLGVTALAPTGEPLSAGG